MSTKAKAEAKFRAVVASNGGEVLGNYAGTLTKVRLRCAEGHEWEATPNAVTNNGTWCPTCAGKSPEVAEAKFRAVVSERCGEVLGEYVNQRTKVGLRCRHGHEWNVTPNSVVHLGTWCPTCAIVARRAAPRLIQKRPRMNKAEERFRTVVDSKGGEVLGDYAGSQAKVRLMCAEGHEWYARPANVVGHGSWCPTCGRAVNAEKLRKTVEEASPVRSRRFRAVVSAKGGEIIGEYVDSKTKVSLRCAKGHEWEATPKAVVHQGTWCPTCANEGRRKVRRGTSSKAEAKFQSVVESKGGVVVGEYVKSSAHVRLRCAKGHEWDVRPSEVSKGRWCPTCAQEAKMEGRKCTEQSHPAAMSLAALVLAMSRVGIDRIEEGNSRQAASRIAIWQKIAGPVVLDGRRVAIGAEDVERNVGLVLPGIETLTAEGFERRLGEIVAGA